MPDDTNAQENIEIPPIPKETAGAVTGAVSGMMIGPGGTVVGGIAGALAGKAAGEGRLRPAAKKAVARIVKPAPARRRPKKTTRGKAAKRKPAKSRKRSTSKRTKAKRRGGPQSLAKKSQRAELANKKKWQGRDWNQQGRKAGGLPFAPFGP